MIDDTYIHNTCRYIIYSDHIPHNKFQEQAYDRRNYANSQLLKHLAGISLSNRVVLIPINLNGLVSAHMYFSVI